MHTFVILARGESTMKCQTVAVSAEPLLVGYVARQLLKEPPEWGHAATSKDPILPPLRAGRRRALEVVIRRTGEQPTESGTGRTT